MPPRPDPLVVTTLRAYRERLDAKELDAMRQMASSWLTVEGRLEADIAALAQEMARRAAAGEVITQQMLWRAERYQVIKAKLADEIRRWNAASLIPQIEADQRSFGWIGIEAATDAIYASYGGPLTAPLFPVLNRAAVEAMVGFLGNGSPLNTLLKQDYPDALTGLADALLQGIARGLGPAQVARNMADGMGMGLERAMLIARTEVLRTYRSANVQAYRASNVVGGFMRLVKKDGACAACLFKDGEHFDVAEELSEHPRGRCIAVPSLIGVPRPRWETGIQWFNAQETEKQRSIIGAERYDLWQAGQIKLSDIARIQHNATWGDSPRVATVKELTD